MNVYVRKVPCKTSMNLTLTEGCRRNRLETAAEGNTFRKCRPDSSSCTFQSHAWVFWIGQFERISIDIHMLGYNQYRHLELALHDLCTHLICFQIACGKSLHFLSVCYCARNFHSRFSKFTFIAQIFRKTSRNLMGKVILLVTVSITICFVRIDREHALFVILIVEWNVKA